MHVHNLKINYNILIEFYKVTINEIHNLCKGVFVTRAKVTLKGSACVPVISISTKIAMQVSV